LQALLQIADNNIISDSDLNWAECIGTYSDTQLFNKEMAEHIST